MTLTAIVLVPIHPEDVDFARWAFELFSSALFFYVLHELVDVDFFFCLTSEWAATQLDVQFEAFSPVLVSPFISEDLITLLAFLYKESL